MSCLSDAPSDGAARARAPRPAGAGHPGRPPPRIESRVSLAVGAALWARPRPLPPPRPVAASPGAPSLSIPHHPTLTLNLILTHPLSPRLPLQLLAVPGQVPAPAVGQDRLPRAPAPLRAGQEQVQHAKAPARRALHEPRHRLPGAPAAAAAVVGRLWLCWSPSCARARRRARSLLRPSPAPNSRLESRALDPPKSALETLVLKPEIRPSQPPSHPKPALLPNPPLASTDRVCHARGRRRRRRRVRARAAPLRPHLGADQLRGRVRDGPPPRAPHAPALQARLGVRRQRRGRRGRGLQRRGGGRGAAPLHGHP